MSKQSKHGVPGLDAFLPARPGNAWRSHWRRRKKPKKPKTVYVAVEVPVKRGPLDVRVRAAAAERVAAVAKGKTLARVVGEALAAWCRAKEKAAERALEREFLGPRLPRGKRRKAPPGTAAWGRTAGARTRHPSLDGYDN